MKSAVKKVAHLKQNKGDVSVLKIHKSVLFPDIHHPYHNKAIWSMMPRFLKDLNPDEVVLIGDAQDMRMLNHHELTKGNVKHFESKRLLADYKSFEEDIIDTINGSTKSDCSKVYMYGNHEEWVNHAINKCPSMLEGVIEIENNVDLSMWKIVPYRDKNEQISIHRIGKLCVIHGAYTNDNHTKKTSQIYGKSVVYGHTHDFQAYTQVFAGGSKDYHIAQSIGCMCDLNPEYLSGKPNKWVNGFAVVYSDPKTGNFNVVPVVISNNQFVFNGKLYKPRVR